MSRASSRDNSTNFSLFPFIAVLLCVMGGLVVVLVSMSQIARDRRDAAFKQAVVDDPSIEQRKQQLTKISQMRAQAEEQNAALSQTLNEGQQRLRLVEDHISRLHQHLQTLKISLAELQALRSEHYDDRGQAERELRRLRELIEQTKAEIAELESERSNAKKSFSIIPYKGPNGTLRRPLYIECLKDKVVLQPEGVVLEPADFAPPIGVGNPLAAVLRAAKQYYAEADNAGAYDPEVEPYPLLIVRPEGIAGYYQVREAIRAWDSDFGYELVGDDWTLAYPNPNPELAALEQQALDTARDRRLMLAEAMPRAYGGGSRFSGREGGTGGGSTEGSGEGGSGGESQPYDDDLLGEGESTPGPNGSMAPSFFEGGGGVAEEDPLSFASAGGGSGGSEGGTGGGADRDRYGETSEGSPQPAGQPNAAGQQGQPNRFAQAGAPGGATGGEASSPGGDAGQPAAGPGGSTVPSPGGKAGAPVAGGATAQGGGASYGPPSERTGGVLRKDEKPRSVVSIRRPLRIFVESDKLTLTPEEGPKRQIASGQGDLRQIGEALRAEVASWGPAGEGMRWMPVVKVTAAPGGTERADRLVRELRRLGVDATVDGETHPLRPNTAVGPTPEGAGVTR